MMIMLLRLFLGCLVISQVFAKFEKEYVVLIEGTAGDTFGSCISFERRNMTGDPITDIEVLGRQTVRTEPLAFFANVGRLGEIKRQIQPIVDFCIDKIPKESLEFSPVFALLGGGVRALNAARQRNVVTVVHQVLRLSCFKVGNESETVMVMTPQQQAAYAYSGVNSVNGRTGPSARPQLLIDLTAGVKANEADSNAVEANIVEVGNLDGSTTRVDAPLLDLEKVSPLRVFLNELPLNADLNVQWPCFPSGYEREELVIKSDGRGYTYKVSGMSDPVRCEIILASTLSDLLLNIPDDLPQRSLPGGIYNALGALETAIVASNPDETFVNPLQLYTGAVSLCGRSWPQLLASAESSADPNAIALQCEIALWTSIVLRDAYRADTTVQLTVETVNRAFRAGAAIGFVLEKASSLPVGAPPRGVRCEEVRVDLTEVAELERVILYQCDCVTFKNYQMAVHHISSDQLLREVMPQFSSAFLYPEKFAAMDPVKYPNEYRVCTSLDTKPGKYNYHCDVHQQQSMNGTMVVREQRTFGNE